MNDKIETTEIMVTKGTSDKIVLAVLCGLTGLLAATLTEKGYFAGKTAFSSWRSNKTNQ